MIGVGGRVSAASTEDVDVLALVTCASESFDSLGPREVSLGVFLHSAAAR
jgi:hypothetical protein